jgi:hypothetical protein
MAIKTRMVAGCGIIVLLVGVATTTPWARATAARAAAQLGDEPKGALVPARR